MNVLMISGDRTLLDPGSEAEKRLAMQHDHVDRLDVMVWPQVHSFWQIVKTAYRHAYDVVTVQDPFWRGWVGLCAARLAGARLNVQVHVDLRAEPWWRRWLAAVPLEAAYSIRAVSERAQSRLYPRHHEKTHTLPIYIDLERFIHLERVPHEKPTILWIGRFEKEKDPLRAIAVLKQVQKSNPAVKLIMLGAGRLEAVLHKAAEGVPVEFPGWKPPEEYLKVADVVLSTSPYESWGASIIEALAAGVPVVAPDVGVAREAGALIADHAHLAQVVTQVLEERPRGELRIAFLSKEEWTARWHKTLV
ncbi:hypothetical protein COU19_00565 [Candidatus Kaiserbacteria bacterium CG10_big_fil_rev_8_21_14_0_10_56_12]|uniref:Glycosyl transferase family 1 domain-containing protein n=1 Tax=Candidatus Kaiserbacteria bacterium CG10_big_fil_rev_8_21_14_0_10_56_12 TaxID=1974611 RepID=A0A2H0UAR8_9BACT|nr:MAG: hypothetical protein COU19_00565 [Candidatus Kaiserbacteria bacterium CG10_big_fil_rev_8_21_14_0_10_56_12]